MSIPHLSKQCIIGLVGEAGAGKDTVGEEFWSLLKKTECVAFAAPMRKMAEAMFSLPPAAFIDRGLKEQPVNEELFGKQITPRRIMQLLGTDCIKPYFGEDIWIKLLVREVHKQYSHQDVIVITDVRFPVELEWLAKMPNSVAVNVHRPKNPHKLVGSAAKHSSAQPLDIYQYMPAANCYNLINNKGFEELEKSVIELIKKLTERGFIQKEQWLW